MNKRSEREFSVRVQNWKEQKERKSVIGNGDREREEAVWSLVSCGLVWVLGSILK